MGYNTRRKSLSLTELGIVLPKRSRAQSHPSPPSTIAEGDESDRPKKMSKTSHAASKPSPPGMMSPPRTTTIRSKHAQELSPPPSPTAQEVNKVDVEGISDDIVVGTIQQLQNTGNRPIFVKELAAVLATSLHSVEKYAGVDVHVRRKCANVLRRSANPSALISSRLTSYLHRTWPTVSPCPLAKDLSPVHPRRLYFYLTTMPRQPVPDTVDLPKANRIISPSLSSASAVDEEEDERYNRARQALSPSPEVDLSSPELDDDDSPPEPPTPGAPFSGRTSVARERSASATTMAHHHHHRGRGASPQLEHEERDFKQTANALFEQALQQRRESEQEAQQDVSMADGSDAVAGAEDDAGSSVAPSIERQEEESEESAAQKNSEAAAALFGQQSHLRAPDVGAIAYLSSPLIQPAAEHGVFLDHEVTLPAPEQASQHSGPHLSLDVGMHYDHDDRDTTLGDWDLGLRSPENVELTELEDMFDEY